MPATYDRIQSQTLTGTAANIDFTSISQSYRDLVVVAYVRGTNASTNVDFMVRMNGSSSNIYDAFTMYGNGATATAARYTNASFAMPISDMVAANATAGIYSSVHLQLGNYASASQNKTFVAKGGADRNGAGTVYVTSGNYFSNTAISQLTFLPSAGSFAIGSMITIYGIQAA